MFSERWNEGNKKEVPLEDIDPKIFKKFLQFIYSDAIVANVAEALELLQVAHKYDVEPLISRCEELLLAKEVTLNYALDVFQAAQKYDKIQLMDKVGDLIAKSLFELQSHWSFRWLSKETLVYILKRKYLQMKEVDLFRLAVKWAKNQYDSTVQESLEDILPLIRFPTMTLEEFTTTVVPTGLLSQSTLTEIFTYFGSNAEARKSMASILKLNTQRRRMTDSIRYVDLYTGDIAEQITKLLHLEKLVDSLELFTHITGTKATGMTGISICCPARLVIPTSGPGAPTFREFRVLVEKVSLFSTSGHRHEGLLSTSPVKAEEGKMTEIKFDTVVPLENGRVYRITVEETPPTSTRLAASGGNYFVAKVFGFSRNQELFLNISNNSVVIKGTQINELLRIGIACGHPQLICRFGLEEL